MGKPIAIPRRIPLYLEWMKALEVPKRDKRNTKRAEYYFDCFKDLDESQILYEPYKQHFGLNYKELSPTILSHVRLDVLDKHWDHHPEIAFKQLGLKETDLKPLSESSNSWDDRYELLISDVFQESEEEVEPVTPVNLSPLFNDAVDGVGPSSTPAADAVLASSSARATAPATSTGPAPSSDVVVNVDGEAVAGTTSSNSHVNELGSQIEELQLGGGRRYPQRERQKKKPFTPLLGDQRKNNRAAKKYLIL